MQRRAFTLAVWKLTSCSGCQTTLLNCEDELLTLAARVTIGPFAEASSAVVRGPYDLSLVEGSVTTADEVRRLHDVRAASRRLIAIGACAVAGGIQALRNARDARARMAHVYPNPEYIDTLATSTAVADHVPVDGELRGCPIDKAQLLDLIGAVLTGRRPRVRSHAVCVECKARGIVCVTVAHGSPCLGPVTHAGCEALCPAYGRGCYGCFGPMDTPNATALAAVWRDRLGARSDDVAHAMRTFGAAVPNATPGMSPPEASHG